MKRLCMLIAATMLAGSAIGQTTDETHKSSKIVTRTYNVSDLIRSAADYPYQSALIPPTELGQADVQVQPKSPPQQGAESGKGETPANGRVGMTELKQLLEDSVETMSWRSKGGTEGDVQSLGSLLVVTQTQSAQDEIQSLLDQVRKEYGPMKQLGIRVRWIVLDPEQLHTLTQPGKGAVENVDEEALVKLGKGVLWAAGQTACFSGQTVFVASGRGRTVVNSAEPVVGTQAVAYAETGQLLQSGAILQVTPVLSPDGKSAVLDLSSIASNWSPPGTPTTMPTTTQGMENVTARPAPMGIDRLNVSVQQMKTTVRVPIGKAVVIGGMTLEPGSGNDQGNKQLYLVAEVHAEQ